MPEDKPDNQLQPTGESIIEIKEMHKWFGEFHVLQDINLTVKKKERIVICGPSGSGKSTLLNLIGLLDSATEGTYLLNQQDVTVLPDEQQAATRNKTIGFVFQAFNLIPYLTAYENTVLPLACLDIKRKRKREMAEYALKTVGLADRLRHLPSELSGGQQQRVAIARALVNEPLILIADEPTGNLDSRTSDSIVELIEELNEGGTTIVVITHNPEIAEKFPRSVGLRDGQIEYDTSWEEVA